MNNNKYTIVAEAIVVGMITDEKNTELVKTSSGFDDMKAAQAALTTLSKRASVELSEYFPERAENPYKITNNFVSSKIIEVFKTHEQ